jgi:hypothetical protein
MPLYVDKVSANEIILSGTPVTVPYADNNDNLIIANTSDNLVNVASGATHQIPLFSGLLLVNDHNSGGIELWIAGGGDGNLVSDVNCPGNSTLTQNGFGYEWTNVDGLDGPFTFTVIKTRNEA